MSAPEFPQPRPFLEIQRAHDLITSILLDDMMRAKIGEEKAVILDVMAGTLCWVLHHDHHKAFAETLAVLEAWLERCGMEIVDSGQMNKSEVS